MPGESANIILVLQGGRVTRAAAMSTQRNTNTVQVGLQVINGVLDTKHIDNRLAAGTIHDVAQTYHQAYQAAADDDLLGIVRGEVLWSDKSSRANAFGQHTPVFSSFNGMTVATSKMHSATGADDDEKFVSVLDEQLMVVGVAQTECAFRRSPGARVTENPPVIVVGGMTDVYNTGDQTFLPGQWVYACVPRPKFRRTDAARQIPGIDNRKVLCEIMPYELGSATPTVAKIQTYLAIETYGAVASAKGMGALKPSTASSELAEALRDYTTHVMVETLLQFMNMPVAQQNRLAATPQSVLDFVRDEQVLAGDSILNQGQNALFSKTVLRLALKEVNKTPSPPIPKELAKARMNAGTNLLTCLNTKMARDLSRVIGVAMSKAASGEMLQVQIKSSTL